MGVCGFSYLRTERRTSHPIVARSLGGCKLTSGDGTWEEGALPRSFAGRRAACFACVSGAPSGRDLREVSPVDAGGTSLVPSCAELPAALGEGPVLGVRARGPRRYSACFGGCRSWRLVS